MIHFEMFTEHTLPMPRIPLKLSGWTLLCQSYPDRALADAIAGIIQFGARVGFQGIRQGQHIAPNLVSAGQLPRILWEDLQEQIANDRLTIYDSPQSLPDAFFSSPLGLVDKSDGKKRRIHHLSHPPGKSVNDGIPVDFGKIGYSTVEDCKGGRR